MMARRDGTLADGSPDAADNRLQTDTVLVRGEDFDGFVWMFRGFFNGDVRELFLNAAASSAVADLGFFGRGVWIDQPITFRASQPRCAATETSPSSLARAFSWLAESGGFSWRTLCDSLCRLNRCGGIHGSALFG